MKIKISIIVGCLFIICSLIIYSLRVVNKYHVDLHYNYFENIGYTDKNHIVKMPIEIMLTDFQIDSINSNATFDLLIQPSGNKNPNKIKKLNITPKKKLIAINHNIYIERYSYNKKNNKLLITLIVEQRKYQTWNK